MPSCSTEQEFLLGTISRKGAIPAGTTRTTTGVAGVGAFRSVSVLSIRLEPGRQSLRCPVREMPTSRPSRIGGALHYLLLYRLGWTEPHRGLHAWAGGHLDEEDDTISLIRRIWIAEHTLEVYHCWSLLAQRRFDIAAGTSTTDLDDARPEARMFPRAGELMLQKPATSRFPLFMPNSGDPLHLQLHFLHNSGMPIVAKLIKH